MPRPKRQSDELYNARRRAKRLIARLEKTRESQTRRERQATDNYISSLREQVSKSYVINARRDTVTAKRDAFDKAAQAARVLDIQTKRTDMRGARQRANRVFQFEMNRASQGKDTSLGEHGKYYVQIFYRATQRIWEGLPNSQRNQAIMAALGDDSLQSAFLQVLNANRRAVSAARHLGESVRGVTDENAWFYNDPGIMTQDSGGSPPEVFSAIQMLR